MARTHEYIRTTKKLGAQGQEKNVLLIVTVAVQKKHFRIAKCGSWNKFCLVLGGIFLCVNIFVEFCYCDQKCHI